MQPLQIWHAPRGNGPNPWKVILVCAELGLPFEIKWISYADIKKAPFTDLNPNGRLPATEDPNTGVTLFESGAIVQYLIAQYDKSNILTYPESQLEEKHLINSWLMFQMSGHGPMLGQLFWFLHRHEEIGVTSAIQRYTNEAKRILRVINDQLVKQRKQLGLKSDEPVWLVGDKCTYADLSFVSWDLLLPAILPESEFDLKLELPEFFKWHSNTIARPAVKKIVDLREHYLETLDDTSQAAIPERHT